MSSATQFHYLISKYAVGPLAVAPKGSRAELVDASEVADRLVELVRAVGQITYEEYLRSLRNSRQLSIT
jgi:hypothetical protein